MELLGVQPLLVGVLGGQFGLDLLVGDDAALGGVDQEHPARLQAHPLDHLGRVEVEDTDLGGHHHKTVLGHPDPGRAQPVAVEHRADDGAVGEAHRGRSVPRLHQRCVIGVEGPAGGVHRVLPLPRLRDHHQHRVGQAAAAEVQQFEHLVEAGGIRGAGGADREDLLQVVLRAEHVALDQRLAGAHPVLVAGDGVDLAVVCDAPERMGQRPGREGVGGEPGVHDAQRALQPLILQIQVERLELRGGQHSLVDEGAAGKAWEIDGFATRAVLARALGAQLVLGALADHVGPPLELQARGAADEQLAEGRHRVTRQRAQRRVVGRHLAPAQHVEALRLDDLRHRLTGGGRVAGRLRQEGDAGGVGPLGRKVETFPFLTHRAQERIGDLQHDAGPVTAVRFGARGPAVLEVQQGGDRLVDNVPATPALDVDDHRDTTGIVFECGVVQPDTSGHSHLALHKLYARRFQRGLPPRRQGFPRASVNGGPAGQQVVKRYAKHRLTCQLSPP